MYESAKEKLKNILQEVKYVSITCDLWTSRVQEAYLTATCHFVDKNFELKSAVLSTEKLLDPTNHNAHNISEYLRNISKTGL